VLRVAVVQRTLRGRGVISLWVLLLRRLRRIAAWRPSAVTRPWPQRILVIGRLGRL
jgi:hypothetical protein